MQNNVTSYRFILVMAAGIFAVFGSRTVHFSGAGPLGVLTVAFVAALRWRKEITTEAGVGCISILFCILSCRIIVYLQILVIVVYLVQLIQCVKVNDDGCSNNAV